MNFLDFRPFAFIISKKNRFHLFELIKDEAGPEGTVLYMHWFCFFGNKLNRIQLQGVCIGFLVLCALFFGINLHLQFSCADCCLFYLWFLFIYFLMFFWVFLYFFKIIDLKFLKEEDTAFNTLFTLGPRSNFSHIF
jgi:hypothetical protein